MDSVVAPVDNAQTALDHLRRVIRTLRLASKHSEQTAGISGAQLFVLHQLSVAPGAALGELAARTLTDPSSVSVVVRRLVERGLVVRHAAADDARRAALYLTAKGERLLRDAPAPVQLRLLGALASLPEAELGTLVRVMEKLVIALDAGESPPDMFFEEEPERSSDRRARRGRS